jgi:hypothetical protein
MKDKLEDRPVRGKAKKNDTEPTPEQECAQSNQAPLPVDRGLALAAERKKADKERADEEAHYIKTLDDNKQISRKPGPLSPGETHKETVDEKGEKRIERKRFSTI